MKKNNNDSISMNHTTSASCHVNVMSCPSRPSLFETLERVKEQVEYECLGQIRETRTGKKILHIDPIYNELCLIIAEVLVRPPDSKMRVRGSEMDVAIVQEVYHELRGEHIEHVAAKFREQGHKIHRKTPYLQTALYNVLFEYDASITNECRVDGLIRG